MYSYFNFHYRGKLPYQRRVSRRLNDEMEDYLYEYEIVYFDFDPVQSIIESNSEVIVSNEATTEDLVEVAPDLPSTREQKVTFSSFGQEKVVDCVESLIIPTTGTYSIIVIAVNFFLLSYVH